MHSRMKLIHNYLFKKFNKHIAYNVLIKVCYRRCHCIQLYEECYICRKQFNECINCDFSADIVKCDGKNCSKLLCFSCDQKFTYGNGKSYCTQCFYMCHRCKEFVHKHVHKDCGYGLCEECYKYNTIIHTSRGVWEICSYCYKKIKVLSSEISVINNRNINKKYVYPRRMIAKSTY